MINKRRLPRIKALFFAFLFITFIGCGAAGTKVTNPPSTTVSNVYPSELSVSSPTESGTSTSSSLNFLTMESEPRYQLSPSEFNDLIQAIIDASTLAACGLDKTDYDDFFTKDENVSCYGPTVDFINHPDGPPADGQLPSGDVGLWNTTEDGTEACPAAEVNSLLKTQKTNNVLLVIASAICLSGFDSTVTTIDQNFVPGNATIDLTAAMNSLNRDSQGGKVAFFLS